MDAENICYIIGAGPFYGNIPPLRAGDYMIAADGGYGHLQKLGREPHMVIGDFDSLGNRPDHPHVVALNREKDDTDMGAALQAGLESGYRRFWLFGGMGGRMDHTLANFQALAMLSRQGARGILIGEHEAVTAITNGAVAFPASAKGYLSVFAHTESAKGVFLRGLKYELTNAEVLNTFPIGVSNEFTGRESRVLVREGTLLVICPQNVQMIFEGGSGA